MHRFLSYPFLESGLKGWDDNKSAEENTKAFSWVPGIAYRPEREAQVRALLQDHPRGEQVLQALTELHSWLSDGGTDAICMMYIMLCYVVMNCTCNRLPQAWSTCAAGLRPDRHERLGDRI